MPRSARRRKTTHTAKGGLKGFANARKSKVDLLREIQSHVVAQEAKHGNDHRSKDKIHVSEIVKEVCPRLLGYKVTGTEATDTVPGAFHQLVAMWAAGTAEHEKWQRWLREMGDLWGTWACLVCEHRWQDTSPHACEECGSGLLRYDEVELEYGPLALTGHADGAVPRKETLVEIKTFAAGSVRVEDPARVKEHTHKVEGRSVIDHDELWKSLKRPLKSHLLQGMFYLWMCEQMGLPYKQITFIYESKTTQATKTFVVTLSMRMIQPYLDTLTAIMEAAETGDVLERPALYTQDAKPCTECPFRTKCWETDDNAGEESTSVPTRGSRPRSEEAGGEAEVRPSRAPRASDPEGPRRRHRPGRPVADRADDGVHPVVRAPRNATGDGRSGRALGRRSSGEEQGPRFARRHRQGRDED